MFFKKAKRFWAGVCVFTMLFTSTNQCVMAATAEELTMGAVDVTESFVEEVSETVSVAEDMVELDLPFAEQKEEEISDSSELIRLGTADGGDDIYYGDYFSFNATTGTLTLAKERSGISDSEFKYPAPAPEEGSWLDGIKTIELEEGSQIKFIGGSAFRNLPNLEKVDLSNGSRLTIIGEYAFDGCAKVKEVLFPNELQEIQKNAFNGCKELTTITLTPSLIKMGNSVFSKCSNLSKVIVEASNLSCGTGIFQDCSIADIQFASNNTVVPGQLFYNATFAENAQIVIPYYIQEIGAGAFNGCATLTSLTFEDTEENPSKLVSIAQKAFYNCKNLKTVTFPNSVKVIEASAYSGCAAIETLVIPNTVTVLGNSAFEKCFGLKELTISNAISQLGSAVFANCTSLPSVEIPSGLTLISAKMFYNCSSLGSVSVPTTVKSVGESAFEKCSALPEIVLPDTVEEVGKKAFMDCFVLSDVTMPKELSRYEDYLFSNCYRLGYLSTSEVPGSYQKGLVIPEDITYIGASAFEDCDGIGTLTITENVQTIQGGAFMNDQNIDTVIFETMDLNCGTKIFDGCLLVNVVFPEEITEIPKNLFSYGGFNTQAKVTIPATVTTIGESAFGGGSGQEEATSVSYIVFEEGSKLTTIGRKAFAYCTAITEFTIPDTVTGIGDEAFKGCKNLQAITIPENVTEIGTSAFMDCEVLTTVTYNAIDVRTTNKDIFKNCNIHTINIGEKVTILPAYLFYGAKFSTNSGDTEVKLITLTIPKAVGEIGEYAFSNITNLSKVFFEKGSELRAVGAYAFNECTALTDCVLPDTVTTIGNAAFKGCVKLERVNIPSALKHLGNYAFYQCGLIEEYHIPAAVTGIGDYTFYGNAALESISFDGYDITAIGESAYTDCVNLEEIIIPSGTGSIGAYAFSGDTALLEVTIPSSVTSIGTDAFKGCKNATFHVVSGSYAETWLKENGFGSQIECMHTITYVLNGGENDVRNIGGYRDGDVFTFYDAIKPGYSFDGWYLDEALTIPVTDLTGRTGDFTVYAKWIEGNYTITYELNGGENDPQNPTNYTYYDAFKFANATREGYTFNGWYLDSEWKTKIVEIKEGSWGNLTLYARWTPKTYTVSFDGRSPKAEVSKKSMRVTFDQVYGELPTATREGYLFEGWFTEDGQLVTKDTIVAIASNHKLYARWVLDVKVAAPTSDYKSGSEFEAGTKVMFFTETPGAEIYYTTDGSDPTLASTLYTEPVAVERNVTIRAIAAKEGYKNSDVSEFVYSVWSTAEEWGDIEVSDRGQFENVSKVPEGIWVTGVEDTVYTGKAIKFNIRVYDHKTLLTEKKDYTIKYSNNKAVAMDTAKKAPTVTITAKGDYKGKIVLKFNILPRDIAGDEFIADDMFGAVNGKFQRPVPVITWGKTKLKNNRDFTVSYESAAGFATEGVYTVTVTGKGNYTGTRTMLFELSNKLQMSKAKVSGVTSAMYNGGEAVTQPMLTVKHSGNVLTKGTDYEVLYENNKEVGTASVIIIGKNNYIGVKRVNFAIKPIAKISKAKISFNMPSVPYTGSAICLGEGKNPLKATVNYQGGTLEEGKDYVIESYSNNKNAGKATVVFKGINGFSGTVKKTFKITPIDLSGLKLKFVAADGDIVDGTATYGYCKGGCKPSVYLEYEGNVLKAGTDYTVSYKGNKKQGMGTLTVKGKKNFKGSKTANFGIAAQQMKNVNVVIQDVPYQKKAGIYVSKPVVTDIDGKKLAAGKDYAKEVTYVYAYDCYVGADENQFREGGSSIGDKDILPAGTMIKATIAGTGTNYQGEVNCIYRIVERSIADATVTVVPQEYTGKAVQPGKDDITVMLKDKNGNLKAIDDKDYDIIGYSKNVAKGTATVTLRGTRNYGGTITVKFKIGQKNFMLSVLEALGFEF